MNRFFKLFLVTFLYILACSTVCFAGFNDIENHWCENEINNFLEGNYVEGYGDGSFRPDNYITRAELCKIVNSYLGYSVSGDWRDANMEVAKEKGYLTTGLPEETITREEAFVTLYRAMKLEEIDSTLLFSDSGDISVWAVPAIKTLSFLEYINGYETEELKPKQQITRAEVVKVLYSFIGIGGVDEETENLEFSVGYLSHNKYGIEFVEIEDELEIRVGDIITLAASVEDGEDVVFEIVSGEEFVEFDEETLRLEGIMIGKVEFLVNTFDDSKNIIINIK